MTSDTQSAFAGATKTKPRHWKAKIFDNKQTENDTHFLVMLSFHI